MGFGTTFGQQYGVDDAGGVEYFIRQDEVVTAADSGAAGKGYLIRHDDVVTATDGSEESVQIALRKDDVVSAVDSQSKVVRYSRRHSDVVTATDAPKEADTYVIRHDDVVTAIDWARQTPRVYRIRVDEVVSAVDSPSLYCPRDFPTASSRSLRPYSPLADLGIVRSVLTTQARYYIARGSHDGTILVPTRFVLGSGWENPRWGEPPPPSSDSTEVITPVFEGDVDVEEANATTFAIRCAGPEDPDFQVQESMVYARIVNSPYEDETYLEIPFACTTFPEWFHVPGQRFVARLVIPL